MSEGVREDRCWCGLDRVLCLHSTPAVWPRSEESQEAYEDRIDVERPSEPALSKQSEGNETA